MIINIRPQQLGSALRADAVRVRRTMPRAAYAAAMRLGAHVANEIDRRGITDQGILKGSVRARRTATGATMEVTAPHAGMVELGTRPHRVSKAAREAIARWAVRKLGLSERDAQRAAWFIGQKIEREGTAPTYVVRDSLPAARRFFAEEMVRMLNSRRNA